MLKYAYFTQGNFMNSFVFLLAMNLILSAHAGTLRNPAHENHATKTATTIKDFIQDLSQGGRSSTISAGRAKSLEVPADASTKRYGFIANEVTDGCAERGDYGADMRPRLDAWMDREVDFEKGYDRTVGIDVVAIPRVRGSKSHFAQSSGKPKLSKRLKREESVLMMLLVVACDIAYVLPQTEPKTEITQQQKDTLRNKMSKLREFIYGERD